MSKKLIIYVKLLPDKRNAGNVRAFSFAVLGFAFYFVREDPGIGILKLRSVNPQYYIYVKFSGLYINSFKLFLDIFIIIKKGTNHCPRKSVA